MASNYEVNIKLDTKKAKDQLRELEERIAKLNRLALRGKASKQILKADRDALALKIKENRLQDQKIKKDRIELKISRDNLRLEKEKAVAIDRQTRAVERKTRTVRAGSMTPMGPSSPLNFTNQGTLLPGPRLGGSTGSGPGISGALSSAIISGAFPLLFGQGPLVAGAGALGGGIGSMVGGQMGGFAGGLLATSIVTPIQAFTLETAKLGAALNDATKDVTAVSAALGITGTEFEKSLKTLEKLGGEEAAFEAARKQMINLVGKDGVNALQQFGAGMADMGNEFTKSMTMMRASLAEFVGSMGVFQRFLNSLANLNLRAQASKSEDPKVKALLQELKIAEGMVAAERHIGARPGTFHKGRPIGDISKELLDLQKSINLENERKALNEVLGRTQEQRVKNIESEIALLERSFELSSSEFEIEKQIMKMKEEGGVQDEDALRTKLRDLQVLEKQRKLADETAAAFERMAQSISTDISKGIQGMIRGTSTLNDMLNNVLNKLIDAAFNMALFGNIQGTLGGGGFFGMFGSFFGKKEKPGKKAADGGRIPGGRASLVGEKGPELFTPATSGYVTPNHALGGSTSISVNVDASGSSVESNEQSGEELGRLMAAAIQAELIKEKRPGGLLS